MNRSLHHPKAVVFCSCWCPLRFERSSGVRRCPAIDTELLMRKSSSNADATFPSWSIFDDFPSPTNYMCESFILFFLVPIDIDALSWLKGSERTRRSFALWCFIILCCFAAMHIHIGIQWLTKKMFCFVLASCCHWSRLPGCLTKSKCDGKEPVSYCD